MNRYKTQTRLQPIRKSVTKKYPIRKSVKKQGGLRKPSTMRVPRTFLREFDFLKTISKNVVYLKPINEDLLRCVTPNSGSGQLIKICPEFVYKGPSVTYQSNNRIYWDKANKSIKVDFYSMNVLIQTALKIALENDKMNIIDRIKQCNPFKLVSNLSSLPFKLFEIAHGKKPVCIEHWDSIVRDKTSTYWYMKSEKYSYNDPRFIGISFRVKDGYIHPEDNNKGASSNAYDRIFMNSPTKDGPTKDGPTKDSPTKVTLKNKSGTFDIECYAETNKIKIANKSLDGTYEVSKSLLNIEEYLRLSVPSDLITPEFIHQGKTWFDQIRTTLQWAYNKIQLHHCDVKAEQFLLDENGNVIVSDLDKATFTVYNDVLKQPVRIRLHRKECEKTISRHLLLHSAKNIGVFSQFMPAPTSMQFEPYPRKNVDYECLCYLSSYLLLVGGEEVNIDEPIYRTFYEMMIEECKIDLCNFEIDLKKLIRGRKQTWANRQNYMHASNCVVYSTELKRKLKKRFLRRHRTKYSPKWNESILKFEGELNSTVSLGEISDTIQREFSRQEGSPSLKKRALTVSMFQQKASLTKQPSFDVNNPIHQIKEQINVLLKSANESDCLDKVILQPCMKTYIIGGPQPQYLDKTLHRFLESEDQDVEKTVKKFYNAIKWRQSLNLFDKHGKYKHSLTEKDFDKIYMHLECRWWFDGKHKQVFYYEKLGDFVKLKNTLDPKTWDKVILLYRTLAMEFQSQFMNKLIHQGHRNIQSITTIYDLSELKFPLNDSSILDLIRRLVKIGQDYYPELLDKAYIANAAIYLKFIIKIIRAMVNEATRDKINVCKPDTEIPTTDVNEFRKWCFPNSKIVSNVSTNTWRPLIGNEFKVRSADYFTTKRKLHSNPALYDCVDVKLLNRENMLEDECRTFESSSDFKIKKLVICVKLAKSQKSILICFQRGKGNDHASTKVFTSFIDECKQMQERKLPPRRFKVIINNVIGMNNKMFLHFTKKPATIQNYGYFREIHNIPVIIIDVNLFSSSNILSEKSLKGNIRMGNCRFDVGFVLQANEENELPERILGCVQFNKLTFDTTPVKFA